MNYFARRQIMLMECDYHRFGGRRKVYEFPSDSTTLAVIDVSLHSTRKRELALILLSLFLKALRQCVFGTLSASQTDGSGSVHPCVPSIHSQPAHSMLLLLPTHGFALLLSDPKDFELRAGHVDDVNKWTRGNVCTGYN